MTPQSRHDDPHRPGGCRYPACSSGPRRTVGSGAPGRTRRHAGTTSRRGVGAADGRRPLPAVPVVVEAGPSLAQSSPIPEAYGLQLPTPRSAQRKYSVHGIHQEVRTKCRSKLNTTEETTEPTEVDVPTPDEPVDESSSDATEEDTFPRSYVEELRQENGKYRQRAQRADQYAQRLHTELVRATGAAGRPDRSAVRRIPPRRSRRPGRRARRPARSQAAPCVAPADR